MEKFLTSEGSETYYIAAAYQLLEWAKLVASKEKAKKYEEVQEEVGTLAEKYEVTADEMFGASCDLDGQYPMLEDDELMEMADKLVAHEKGWI
jgi:hypothetical protein